jgi:hypothetical protein
MKKSIQLGDLSEDIYGCCFNCSGFRISKENAIFSSWEVDEDFEGGDLDMLVCCTPAFA